MSITMQNLKVINLANNSFIIASNEYIFNNLKNKGIQVDI